MAANLQIFHIFLSLSSLSLLSAHEGSRSGSQLAEQPFIPSFNDVSGFDLVENEPLSKSVNKSLDPCEDFYDFVCDGWKKNRFLAAYEAKASQFNTNDATIRRNMKVFIENTRALVKDSHASRLFFTMYDKCMDNDERRRYGTSTALSAVEELREARTVTEKMIMLKPQSVFYDITVTPDMRNVTTNRLTISPSPLEISCDYYMNPKYGYVIAALKRYLLRVSSLAADDDESQKMFKRGEKEIARRVSHFFHYESKIARIIYYTAEHRDNVAEYYNLRSLAEMRAIASAVDWQLLLLTVMPDSVLDHINMDAIFFHIRDVNVIQKINEVIRSGTHQMLDDYLGLKVLLRRIDSMDDRYRDAKMEFYMTLYGTTAPKPNWMRCLSIAMASFPDVANYHYITNFFDMKSQHALNELFESLRASFSELIWESSWMDLKTKEKALQKVYATGVFIGFHPEILDATIMERKFADLDFNSSWTFPDILEEHGSWNMDVHFKKLLQPNDRRLFHFSSPRVNAFYYAGRNQIALLPGILTGAFFDTSMPAALNYGGLGAVIGHEITHGFDNNGRQYDARGNLNNWWNPNTRLRFLRQKRCFVEQYGSIEVPNTMGTHINGLQTVGENIADNGGLRAAYKAFKRAQRKTSVKSKRVKGLENFNDEQLFFINSAYTWCSTARPQAELDGLLNDAHAPEKHRVNVALSNQKEFLRAFHCPSTSAMAKSKSCQLW